MSALSAAKLGLDRAAPKVNRLLMAVTDALVLFIDALLKVEQQAKPGMPDKTGPLSQLLRAGGRGGLPAVEEAVFKTGIAHGRAWRRARGGPPRYGEANGSRFATATAMCLLVEAHVFACRGSCVCL